MGNLPVGIGNDGEAEVDIAQLVDAEIKEVRICQPVEIAMIPIRTHSLIQSSCESRSLHDRPMVLTPRDSHSFWSFATSPSSVVQTGVLRK